MTNSLENDDPWEDRLSEYLDGLLTKPETLVLEEHLQTCERCRTALVGLHAVVERLHGDGVDRVEEGTWPRIANRLTRTHLDSTARAGRSSPGALQSTTLRKIAFAASIAATLAAGVWAGAFLRAAAPGWSPPAWMHLRTRASGRQPVSVPATGMPAPNRADSIRDGWTQLRRSLAALDQQIAEAVNALKSQPANDALRRAVLQLARERQNLQALLDSVTVAPHP
jgi:anti-sigma factor RsiW